MPTNVSLVKRGSKSFPYQLLNSLGLSTERSILILKITRRLRYAGAQLCSVFSHDLSFGRNTGRSTSKGFLLTVICPLKFRDARNKQEFMSSLKTDCQTSLIIHLSEDNIIEGTNGKDRVKICRHKRLSPQNIPLLFVAKR
jgi:hypothetical protein